MYVDDFIDYCYCNTNNVCRSLHHVFLKVFTVLLIRDSITKHMNLLIHSWCDIAWNRVGTVIGR